MKETENIQKWMEKALSLMSAEEKGAVAWVCRNMSVIEVLCKNLTISDAALTYLKEDAQERNEILLSMLLCAMQAIKADNDS